MEDKFIARRKVLEVLKIHYQTLYRMIENKQIETIQVGQRTLYNLDKYLREKNINNKEKKKICYCRVSSNKQKDDLKRQIEYMTEKYPDHELISDIGSGLNYNREGLRKIIDYAINGEIEEIVIAYKDRLTRFGYEMIEYIVEKYSKGKIKITNKTEEETPEEEITKDIVTIMNVYVAKINGLRKYKKQMRKEIQNKKK
jgi:putative resolvase